MAGEPTIKKQVGQKQLGRSSSGAPTIRDVAQLAGVSRMTVSRVMNREDSVHPQTRTLVQTAIRTLNYVPNAAARALSGAEHTRIALLHRYPNPGPLGEILIHLVHELARCHSSLVVRTVSADADHETLAQDLASEGVRAAILAPPLADDAGLTDVFDRHNIVVVATGSSYRAETIATVGVDESAAAGAVTRHLLSLGHRRIGFIKGDPGHASTGFRLAGYRAALDHAGLSENAQLIVQGHYTYQSGMDAAEELLSLRRAPTAIFASNDDMAAAVVAVAHRKGIAVPSDLSVCGFDDTYLATAIWPALTTVRQPMREVIQAAIGFIADELARARAGDPKRTDRVTLKYELVRRQSDAAPRQKPSGLLVP